MSNSLLVSVWPTASHTRALPGSAIIVRALAEPATAPRVNRRIQADPTAVRQLDLSPTAGGRSRRHFHRHQRRPTLVVADLQLVLPAIRQAPVDLVPPRHRRQRRPWHRRLRDDRLDTVQRHVDIPAANHVTYRYRPT